MRIITVIGKLEAAKKEWYERLADFLVSLVDWKDVSVLLERDVEGDG